MRFILLVEGYTERKAVPAFLKQWLDPQLRQPVGIKPVRFEGWAELVDDVAKKAHSYLDDPSQDDVVAVISLLDLYVWTPVEYCSAWRVKSAAPDE